MLCPDGSGINAAPGSFWGFMDLTKAYLIGANLTGAYLSEPILTDADFSQANLSYAHLEWTTLGGADFTNADIRGAYMGSLVGFSADQLYSTVNYKSRNLSGLTLAWNNLSGWSFAGQNLSNASFLYSTLTGADFTNASVRGTSFYYAGLTASQLYSTASYQARDLTGIVLSGNNVTGWNFAGQNISGAYLQSAGLTAEQLYSTASYSARDLRGVHLGFQLDGWNFEYQDLTGAALAGSGLNNATFRQANLADADFRETRPTDANFREANLTNANFEGATLTGADFTGAIINGANFNRFVPGIGEKGTGITKEQLYATVSYQTHDLRGVSLLNNRLNSNLDLSDQNLQNANLDFIYFLGGTFDGADFRGAASLDEWSGTSTKSVIWQTGLVHELDLRNGRHLLVRDYDGNSPYFPAGPPFSVHVLNSFMDGESVLQFMIENDEWGSTISFRPGIALTLDGTLELSFADSVQLATQIGRTIRLFDWTGVTPIGQFDIVSPYSWDLSKLYTTGEVTLVPEPTAVALALVSCVVLLVRRSR
jgi:uncharacterized protein YjbI with pentapeptide repeats